MYIAELYGSLVLIQKPQILVSDMSSVSGGFMGTRSNKEN